MRKDEFLQILRRALNGEVPPSVVEETIRYYDDYITQESRKGASEEEVIAEIGDPRLIAKTIEDTTDGAGEGGYQDDFGETAQGTTVERDMAPGSAAVVTALIAFGIEQMVLEDSGNFADSWYYLSDIYGGRRDFCPVITTADSIGVFSGSSAG